MGSKVTVFPELKNSFLLKLHCMIYSVISKILTHAQKSLLRIPGHPQELVLAFFRQVESPSD